MGSKNYDIERILAYVQHMDPETAGYVSATAQRRLRALNLVRDETAFRLSVLKSRDQGSVRAIIIVIEGMDINDAEDLRRLEAVAHKLYCLFGDESSSTSESTSSEENSHSSTSSIVESHSSLFEFSESSTSLEFSSSSLFILDSESSQSDVTSGDDKGWWDSN